ncbi:hypothetical protein GCM10007981_00580 [Thermocladium modestius]|uniref:N-acetyltransferase domain-containing protein n=1 Tax=Thermocladium modestius TaxID=62609 RepID=A0A830GTA8_9CREN|nr:GNAT family N-acetyltransferase [Thermocladium modestius]GGP18934.1 hypothetical protein GCM10007981_00580 [Thermocladium modestius]
MISLARCGEEDAGKVEELERLIFKPSEQYTMSFIAWLCRSCSRFSFIAYDDGRPVGYIISCVDAPGQGHVVAVGLLREYRGRGLGRQLMCASMCSLSNVERLVLEVRVSNEVAQSLYRSLGFHVADQLKSYYSDGEDAYYMVMEDEARRRALKACGCGEEGGLEGLGKGKDGGKEGSRVGSKEGRSWWRRGAREERGGEDEWEGEGDEGEGGVGRNI